MFHDVDITVHHFYSGTCSSSPTNLLDTARDLVVAATEEFNWHSVKPFEPHKFASLSIKSKAVCYVWARTPPVAPQITSAAHLEEWDAPLEEVVEVIDLSTLPDFECTDLGEVLRPKSRAGKRKSRSRSRSNSPSRRFADNVDINNLASRSAKRRCSSPISISKLIPFPHYYESLDPLCPPPPEIERIPAFRVTRGVSITLPYSRTAWLVPLRGCPPFDGASSATLCSSNKPPALPPESPSPIRIQWTPSAISQFWTFLLHQRSMNNFGPIAFSYAFGQSRQGKRAGDCDMTRGWEYIKIYHDGQYALRLRSLLDSFRWDGEKPVPDASRHNRVLKGARLVLLDEAGDTVLMA